MIRYRTSKQRATLSVEPLDSITDAWHPRRLRNLFEWRLPHAGVASLTPFARGTPKSFLTLRFAPLDGQIALPPDSDTQNRPPAGFLTPTRGKNQGFVTQHPFKHRLCRPEAVFRLRNAINATQCHPGSLELSRKMAMWHCAWCISAKRKAPFFRKDEGGSREVGKEARTQCHNAIRVGFSEGVANGIAWR